MQALQAHAPEMKRIQQKYKHDKTEAERRAHEVLQGEQDQPGGVVPADAGLQFPVFIALYYTLKHFNSNFLCTTPLTSGTAKAAKAACDAVVAAHRSVVPPLHPVDRGRDDGAVGRLRAARRLRREPDGVGSLHGSDRAEARSAILFMVMPLVFVFVIAHFPAGLVLYWVTTNLWTVGQGLITRRLVQRTPAPAPERRSSRTAPQEDEGTSGNGASPEPRPRSRAPAVTAARAGAAQEELEEDGA